MKHILSERSRMILQNVEVLEEKLNITISNKGRIIIINGSVDDEYFAEKVLGAINFGFSIDEALTLKDEDNIFQVINIKEFSNTSNLERVRGRIIGTRRKTLKSIETLTNCILVLKNNQIGIIGNNEEVENAIRALSSLIKGAKTANVYAYLEKHHPAPITDYGLKPKKRKKTKA